MKRLEVLCTKYQRDIMSELGMNPERQAPHCVFEKSNNLEVRRGKVLRRWKEYFDELL